MVRPLCRDCFARSVMPCARCNAITYTCRECVERWGQPEHECRPVRWSIRKMFPNDPDRPNGSSGRRGPLYPPVGSGRHGE